MAKKFGWSPAIPYPLAWLRLLINLIVFGTTAGLIKEASENYVLTVHPCFCCLCWCLWVDWPLGCIIYPNGYW